jgi:chemotaxis receptor (MCP) glutamine deamidase CheD
LIDRLKHTHESFETLEKGAFAPRLGAVLIGGCIPLIESYDEESTPELLAISLRTTQTIKRSLQASEIPLRWEQTGGQHRCSIHVRGSRVTIGQERGLREPLISEINIHHPKWQLSQQGQTQPLT